MGAIVYKNTKTNIPGWETTTHETQPRGMAYVEDNYFIHLYGKVNGFWVLSSGLTASQQVSGSLEDWVANIFGADEVKPLNNLVGEVIVGVWRPGLYYQSEVFQALAITEYEQRSAEQALRILIDKLDDLLLYIEPSQRGLSTFSHKTRELLILASTEVENIWKQYMDIAGVAPKKGKFNTLDYVKLHSPLFLSEYQVKLRPYKDVPPIKPFSGWDVANPTKSLPWYDAYNKTKHDRMSHFNEATLLNCIHAVAANVVMFCVRYSPYPLIHGSSTLSTMVNQLFEISLVGSDSVTFYLPK